LGFYFEIPLLTVKSAESFCAKGNTTVSADNPVETFIGFHLGGLDKIRK
jgi:hypothetical protein